MNRCSKAALSFVVMTLVVGATAACDGKVGLNGQDGPGDPTDPSNPGTTGPPTVETPNGTVEPTAAHLRRLTAAQYATTVRAALGDFVPDDAMPDFGDDIPTIGMNNSPSLLRVNDINVNSLYEATEAIAAIAVEENAQLAACATGSGDACFAEVIDEVGAKLWRRPVADAERDDLLGARQRVAAASGSRAEQLQLVTMALLASPNTLFRRELGTAEGGLTALSDYELASALAYTFWNAPPDAELYALAAEGRLTDPDTLQAQIERMLQDPKLADSFVEFFVDYLKVEALFAKTKLDSLGLTPQAREALVEGIRRDLHEIFSAPDASLLDPFYSTAFAINDASATFFGVPVTQDGNFEIVGVDPNERLGVLSHPAFLSTHAGEGDSGIVKRGVFTLEQLLCVRLGAPPANIGENQDVPSDFNDAEQTSRAVLTVRHSSQPECVTCHQTIDPAGFGYENYDSAGRFRLTEKDDIPIDASGELRVAGSILSFENSVDFIETMVGSEALRSCLTTKYFTYALGAEPGIVEQRTLFTAFAENDGAVDALARALVATPSFTQRTLKEAP